MRMHIYSLCDVWLQKRKDYIRKNTYINYDYAIRRFKRFFADCLLDELTANTVSETFRIMAMSCSRSSIYNVRQVFRAIFNYAKANGLTENNPFAKAQIPLSAAQKTVEAYTSEEEQKIIDAACSDPLGDCYIFLLLSGLRISEFINLTWDDYNPRTHTLRIRESKTRSGVATIAISQKAELIILRQKHFQHNHIFSNTQCNPISISSMKKMLKRIKAETGVSVTNHKCRHTFCTRLIEAGADPKTVSTLARHSSVAFTMQRYVSSDLKRQRDALAKLDAIIK